jgi:thiol:disulfide interchange protein
MMFGPTRAAQFAPFVAVAALALFSRPVCGQDTAPSDAHTAEQAPSSYYVVADYDTARNPAEDVRAAIDRAQAEHKRVLVEVGGQWCGWCKILDLYFKDTPEVHALLEQHFLIVKVNFSRENENAEFLSQYPTIHGYPHIFVLESDGRFLHSQDTGLLEEGRGYNQEAVVSFLQEWMPGGSGAS